MAISSNVLFGRNLRVEVRNYQTNEKIILNDTLEIDYTFTKHLDIVREQNVGTVNIHGLSEETFKKINSELNDVFVYTSYGDQEPQLLFVATITGVSRNYNDEKKTTSLQVSSNFKEFVFNKIKISSKTETPISLGMLIAERLGYGFTFTLDNIPKEHHAAIGEYLMTYELRNVSITQAPKQTLEAYLSKFGFTVNSAETSEILTFRIDDQFIPVYLDRIQKGYRKAGKSGSDTFLESYKDVFEKDADSREAVLLNENTGMRGYPVVERHIVTVSENWDVANNEEVTYESQVALQNRKLKDAERVKKYNERVKKAEESGRKTPKPLKPRKIGKKRIKRVYIKVQALINPEVKPMSQIKIQSHLKEYDGVYRVRYVTFSGSNYADNTMEIYAEDANDRLSTNLTPQEEKQAEVNGSLGENYE